MLPTPLPKSDVWDIAGHPGHYYTLAAIMGVKENPFFKYL